MRLRLVDRERPARGAAPLSGRVLAQASIEHFDRRDGRWWPLLSLPPVWLGEAEPAALSAALEALIREERTGFEWQGARGGLALQVQRDSAGSLVVEAGADLAAFLAEHAGSDGPAGESLALFRLHTSQAGLVAFAAELRAALAELDG